MKNSFKFTLLAFVLCSWISAGAQVGIKSGYLFSRSAMTENSGDGTLTRGMNGFYVGANYDLALPAKGLSLRAGLNYTYLGGKGKVPLNPYLVGDGRFREHYFDVPVDVKWGWGFGRGFKLYAFAGPRLSVGLASFVNFTASTGNAAVPTIEGKWNLYNGKFTSQPGIDGIGQEFLAFYNRFDFQLGAGVGFQWKGVSIEAGYDWGVLNRIKKNLSSYWTTRRNQLVVGVGYSF